MKRLTLLSLLAAVLAIALLAPQASAQRPVQVIQTDCDTLSLNPPLVQISFAVINLGPTPVCSFRLTPIQSGPTPADSCRILQCAGAPGWNCVADPSGSAGWFAGASPGCILTGQKHEPFSVVLDPLYCCYSVQYFDASGNLIFEDTVCFECLKPVAAVPSTWGNLKSIYR